MLPDEEWHQERWWYKLAHVCRRWRRLILTFASHLRLRLLCTYGTPVADMLANSPPLPLVIDHFGVDHDVTAEDEERILLALKHRDRIRSIRLWMPSPSLQNLTRAIEDEFPILECLSIEPLTDLNTILFLPKSFHAPRLREFFLVNFTFPIGPPLLMTTVGLATLLLANILPSAHFHINDLLQPLSLMPQLEALGITFHPIIPDDGVERHFLHTPITMHITLPNLYSFTFGGASAYLEALLPRMTTPLLIRLRISFFSQLTFSVTHLLQFINTTKNHRFRGTLLTFGENVSMSVYTHVGARIDSLFIKITCEHLNRQLASAAQILHGLGRIFSAVEYLTLECKREPSLPEWNNAADWLQWRELLRPFRKVKTIHVPDSLVRRFSHSLRLEAEESPTELLPELKELSYSGSSEAHDVLTAFRVSRENAGYPVTLVGPPQFQWP